jgi:hypothetical protein
MGEESAVHEESQAPPEGLEAERFFPRLCPRPPERPGGLSARPNHTQRPRLHRGAGASSLWSDP